MRISEIVTKMEYDFFSAAEASHALPLPCVMAAQLGWTDSWYAQCLRKGQGEAPWRCLASQPIRLVVFLAEFSEGSKLHQCSAFYSVLLINTKSRAAHSSKRDHIPGVSARPCNGFPGATVHCTYGICVEGTLS